MKEYSNIFFSAKLFVDEDMSIVLQTMQIYDIFGKHT